MSAIPITAVPERPGETRLRRLTAAGRRGALAARHLGARATAPIADLATRLAQIPLTVAGVGCIDAAAFVGDTIAGLVITGLSLIGLEYLIADDK